ncbi:MAG: DUF3368 domain-containing protein [Pyrinomonadaceae bacterium]|nr:DUF3368 domain-containing protein [Pyrinomonadaceae bacterium]
MIIVSDTSPISNLLKIGEIDLLRLTFSQVRIPDAVYYEICQVEAHRIALESLDWIERASLADISLRDKLLGSVDIGEAEAIALALELSADYLLIDESMGRNVALEMGLKITGLLGVLLRAKADGHIPLVEPYVNRLVRNASFRLSPALIADTLYQAGER